MPSSGLNSPNAAAIPDTLEDGAASTEASSDTASSEQNSPQTMDAAAIPQSLEDDAVSIDTSSDSAVSHMAAESSATSSTPHAGSNSMAAQTFAGSLQQFVYEQSTAAAATRLAAPRSAAARRAYQAARASDLPWSDVEEVFDRKWHGGGRPTHPRPATAAGGSSPAPLPADRTPQKR